ncbi:MFS transporter [Paractinoplanes lichenicola]|uniref:MFS transporter n=1 Tax=Paractinoplanes lichenicola TaxID=2802976 RepID=A0ABS1W2D9_9ACTN|nr:MFS transporter [Actinoplanes lichenicola]MBL7260915.1 MFS transporter [Actinoplanes lichenicola]
MSFTSGETRWRDVYIVAGSKAVSVCGDFLAATTLALVLQQSGHGGLAVSGLMLAASLPLALLAPITGRLADRADSRTILTVVPLLQAGVCLALAFTRHPVAIIGLVALLACGLAFTQPVTAALLPEIARRADLAKASGLSQTAGNIGMLVAPALAGILVGQSGARLPLLLDAASYLALVVAALFLRTRRKGLTDRKAPLAKWRLRDDRTLTVMVGVLAATIAGVSMIQVVEVFLIRDTLGASTTLFGFVAASWTVGMLAGNALFSRVRPDRVTVSGVLLVTGGSCLPLLLGAAVPGPYWLIPLWIAGGVCNGGINIFTMVIIAGRTPSAARGRAFAALNAAVQGSGMIGLLVAGPLVEVADPRLLMAVAGAFGLVTILVSLPLVRREPPSVPLTSTQPPARDSVAA